MNLIKQQLRESLNIINEADSNEKVASIAKYFGRFWREDTPLAVTFADYYGKGKPIEDVAAWDEWFTGGTGDLSLAPGAESRHAFNNDENENVYLVKFDDGDEEYMLGDPEELEIPGVVDSRAIPLSDLPVDNEDDEYEDMVYYLPNGQFIVSMPREGMKIMDTNPYA